MSDYKRGKLCVQVWAGHWEDVAEMSEASTTVEADLIEYGVAIRQAFNLGNTPNILLMTRRIKKTHHAIMHLPIEQREMVIVWHFGDEDERKDAFGSIGREPSKMKNIYKKIGRRV
jgi:hypothetical protein